MLYHLHYLLSDYFSVFNVFRYITFRSMAAFVVALLLVLILQPIFIRWIQKKSPGQPIRDDGPQTHLVKQGTPTMGGVVVVAAVVLSTLLFSNLGNIYIWTVLGLTLFYGALGFVDDFRKVGLQDTKGVRPKTKLLYQAVIAAVFTLVLIQFAPNFSTVVQVPFFKNLDFDLGLWFIPFSCLVIVGASNAVNLTDGLDGLVIGPIMTTAFAYGVFAYVAGNVKIADYLQISYITGSGEVAIFA
ncbi:unnamed protein product, partial [marine sediment metagenome]